ncbi:MAG: bifunctional 3-deoxy-7-phosphoheptulonate synthase/chorismate mutase [Thermoactinomyces sp.]
MIFLNIDILMDEIGKIDREISDLLSKRKKLVSQMDEAKQKREYENKGLLHKEEIDKKINQGLLENRMNLPIHQDGKREKTFLYSRKHQDQDTVINIKGQKIGNGDPHFIMGPCAVESLEQLRTVAGEMTKRGLKLLRGGAFKPRTSPYDFQGLGLEGLKILKKVAGEYGMAVITEIMSTDQIDETLQYIDVIQVGARNMHNFSLLKAVGKTDKPVLLKRGLSATIKEFKLAAEYILLEGNKNVILCERGIRTYETATRNTLDISAVPILKQETHLPVLVDITHSTGRKDLLIPAARAALAIGADGIMAEVHPNPQAALSDAKQQMNISEFHSFMDSMEKFLNKHAETVKI